MNRANHERPHATTGELRTPAGALDHEAYARRARRLRGETLGDLLATVGQWLRVAGRACWRRPTARVQRTPMARAKPLLRTSRFTVSIRPSLRTS